MFYSATESDATLINLLRKAGSASVGEVSKRLQVTATAGRQRLNRLMGDGLVRRELVREGRGRPSHRYLLTEKGLRAAGDNYADLVEVLWTELRAVQDRTVRTGLLQRIAHQLAARSGLAEGNGLEEKMRFIAKQMGEKQLPFEVDNSGKMPVLTALACPYPDLAERDRGICAMEKMLLSEALGESVQLTDCRLDGSTCCSFAPSDQPG